MVLQQLHHTVVHDGLRQHLELEKFADELNVADGTPSGLVLGFLQLLLKPLTLRRLRVGQRKYSFVTSYSEKCSTRGDPELGVSFFIGSLVLNIFRNSI